MFLINKKNKKKKGSTLIEALALLTLFSIATLAFYKMYTESTVLILEAKRRLIAVELAAEKMEQFRNVPYDKLIDSGTVGGKINRDETITVNNVIFRIITHINFIDDPIDGLAGADTNSNINDYKRIKVFVLWSKGTDSGVTEVEAVGSNYEKYRIELTSTFISPAGFEGVDVEYGILSINVINSEGNPIVGATVDIFCDECNTDVGTVDFVSSETTDINGSVTVSVPPSYFGSKDTENYEITITKLGYQTTKTHEKYNGVSQLYEPLNTHLTVQGGRRTIETFVVDEVHTFPLQVMNPYCENMAGAHQIYYEGGRIVGTNPVTTPNETLYDLDDFFSNTTFTANGANGTTGAVDIQTDTDLNGSIDVSDDASTGVYELNVSDFESNNPNLTFWKMMPNDGYDRNKLYLGGIISPSPCNFIAMDETVDSLQIIVKDSNTGLPLQNASVRVQNTTLGYVASEETDEFGRTYFPNDKNIPLVQDTYDIRISKSGYSTYNGTKDTSSGGLNGLTVNMTP